MTQLNLAYCCLCGAELDSEWECSYCGTDFMYIADELLGALNKLPDTKIDEPVSKSDQFIYTICVDFDGVIHSYDSGWKGVTEIPDPPVPGAFHWLSRLLVEGTYVKPVIYSSRSSQYGGIEAMQKWFIDQGFPTDLLAKLEFPKQKPAAFLTLDDRAIVFEGEFPTIEQMKSFKPWNRR